MSVHAVATKLRLGAVLVGAMVAATACGGSPGGSAASPSSPPPANTAASSGAVSRTPSPGSASPSASVPTSGAPRPTGQAAGCVDRTLAGMSLAQRVGQLFMVGVNSSGISQSQLNLLRAQHIGSIQLMGHTSSGSAAVRAGVNRARSAAQTAGGTRVGLLVATDQEGGQVQTLNGAGFNVIPNAVAQGRLPASTLQQRAATWGRQLRSAGVDVDLAPVADIVPSALTRVNQPIGVLSREYGNTSATVARQTSAFVRGLGQAGVFATLKHYPTLGQVRGNTDFSAGVDDTVTPRGGDYLIPYRSGIGAGARFVLVSTATYTRIDPHHQAVFSSILLRDVLRGTLGFRGIVISDDLGKAVAVQSVPPGQRAVGFLGAGGDMVLTDQPTAASVGAMTSAVQARARQDRTFRSGVDASVRRVLDAKLAAGQLFCSG
jgi:beta-N-acetylhexosaminidase